MIYISNIKIMKYFYQHRQTLRKNPTRKNLLILMILLQIKVYCQVLLAFKGKESLS